MKWDLVVFDLDGTLIDTIKDLSVAVNYSLAKAGFPEHSIEECRGMVGHGIRNLVISSLPPAYQSDSEVVDTCLKSFLDYYVAHIDVYTRPYDGVHDVLRKLSSEGVKVAVASNKFQEGAEKLVAEFFGDVEFCAVLGNKEGLPLKPDPEVVGLCRRAAGLPVGSRIAFVGDSPTDMRTAAAAGVAAIGVSWGFRSAKDVLESGAQVIAYNAEELESILSI